MKRKPNMVDQSTHTGIADAVKILQDATEAIDTRSGQHGHTENSFAMIAEMWTTYISNTSTVRGGIGITPDDVAKMMTMLKIARSVYGHGRDNFVDAAGYMALASILELRDTAK